MWTVLVCSLLYHKAKHILDELSINEVTFDQ